VLNPWSWVLYNLRRSTRYWVRRRRRGRRHLRLTDIAVPFARGHTRRRNPLVLLLSLSVPGLALGLFTLPRLLHPIEGFHGYFLLTFMALAGVFALRAWVARAPVWIRAAGVVASLLHPVLYALARCHVIGA
jgi:hypothetical protein